MKPTDIRVREVSFDYEDFRYRTPIKFGGVALDRVTILNVRMVVESGDGKPATGFGSMPLGNGNVAANVWVEPAGDVLQGGGVVAVLAERPQGGREDLGAPAAPLVADVPGTGGWCGSRHGDLRANR